MCGGSSPEGSGSSVPSWMGGSASRAARRCRRRSASSSALGPGSPRTQRVDLPGRRVEEVVRRRGAPLAPKDGVRPRARRDGSVRGATRSRAPLSSSRSAYNARASASSSSNRARSLGGHAIAHRARVRLRRRRPTAHSCADRRENERRTFAERRAREVVAVDHPPLVLLEEAVERGERPRHLQPARRRASREPRRVAARSRRGEPQRRPLQATHRREAARHPRDRCPIPMSPGTAVPTRCRSRCARSGSARRRRSGRRRERCGRRARRRPIAARSSCCNSRFLVRTGGRSRSRHRAPSSRQVAASRVCAATGSSWSEASQSVEPPE